MHVKVGAAIWREVLLTARCAAICGACVLAASLLRDWILGRLT